MSEEDLANYTPAERQMIEMLREWGSVINDPASLLIEFNEGGWEVVLFSIVDGKKHVARGVGKTFNTAWDETANVAL
jgi:hypothetical protein